MSTRTGTRLCALVAVIGILMVFAESPLVATCASSAAEAPCRIERGGVTSEYALPGGVRVTVPAPALIGLGLIVAAGVGGLTLSRARGLR